MIEFLPKFDKRNEEELVNEILNNIISTSNTISKKLFISNNKDIINFIKIRISELDHIMKNEKPINEDKINSIIIYIISGCISFLTKKKIFDIKPKNMNYEEKSTSTEDKKETT